MSAFAAFIAVIVGANLLTHALGLVTIAGLVATAGTWLAGFAFVARDALHERLGPRVVVAAVIGGCVITAAMSPTLALASCAAFATSELVDLAIYAPLRRRGYVTAAISSNIGGAVVDTALFLAISGFSLEGLPTQVLIKVGTTTAFVLAVRRALLREPVRACRSASHA